MGMTLWTAFSDGWLWLCSGLSPLVLASLRALGGSGEGELPAQPEAADPTALPGEPGDAAPSQPEGEGEPDAVESEPFGANFPYRGPQRPDPDHDLVLAVAQGDPAAYRGLVERYQSRIYGVCYGMVRNSEDARDMAQEAFVKAFRNIDKFRFGSSFYHWLCRIAINVSIDLLRRQKVRRAEEFDEGRGARESGGGFHHGHHRDDPRRELERKGLRAKISAALDTLPAEQRQVLVLREMEGLSYKEIADVMGIPEGTVMSRLFYARKKMQALLKDEV